jgi:chemotaxis signal transduction protein
MNAERAASTALGPTAARSALVVGLRGELYAFPQAGAAILLPWLQRYRRPSPLPAVPSWISGLISVRGAALVVIDLGLFLDLGFFAPAPFARLVFLEHGEHQVGFVVDEEIGIRYIMPVGAWDAGELLAGEATVDGRRVRVLNGDVLIDRLALGMEDATG